MSRNGSTRRFWSGTTVLSLLGFLFLFLVTTAVAPPVQGAAGIKVTLPSGRTVTAPPPAATLSPKGFSPGGGAILSSGGGGDPVDRMVGPTTRINQPSYEGDCATPAGCTQNTPSIAKSGNVIVTGYMSTWGLHQGTPTHVGLFSYSTDGGKTWYDGQLLLPQANPDQILGPPAITADGNGNFWYAAEYQTITGECAIAVGQSQHPAGSPSLLFFDPPTLVFSSTLDKAKNPRIAVDKRNGNLYVVYTYIPFGCGTMFEPGDPGIWSMIGIQEYDTATGLWSPMVLASAPQQGPAFVDGADVAVDANTSSFPFLLPGIIYVAWEQFDPSTGFPVAPTHTISGATLTTGLGFFGPPYTIGPVNTVVPPPGYSGMLVYDPNCTTPICSWVPGLRSFPSIATHPQKTGEAYVVWNSAFEDVLSAESFESASPWGWTISDVSSSGVVWDRNDNYGVGNVTGGTGYSAAIYSSGAAAIDSTLDSAAITLAPLPDPTTRLTLTFRSYFVVAGGAPAGTVSLSADGGMTWTPPFITLLGTTGPGLLSIDLSPWAGQSVILRWEYADAAPVAGNLWQIDDVKITISDAIDSEILFAKTTDQGSSWFTPTRVNDNPVGDLTAQFMPAIATRTDDGLIKVVFYDQRYSPYGSGLGLTDIFVAESRDSGLTFEPNVRVTATSMDWLPGWAFVPSDSASVPNYGLRIGATMDADHLYMAWSGPPATGFEGPDIYTAYAQNIARITTGDLDFGNVCPGETKTLDFEIFNTGTADLEISNITFTSGTQFSLLPTTTFPVTISPDSHVTFTIVMTLGATDTAAIDSIEISHNDPNVSNPLILKLSANVQVPSWTVSASSVDFGGVPWHNATNPTGGTRTMPVVVTNTGACPVTIQTLAFTTGTDFSSPTPVPFVLTAGSNARIDVVFDPAAAGALSDTLTIGAMSPPAAPASLQIALSGVGLDPTIALELPGFGGVPVDDVANPGNFAADRTLKIHNTGTANVQITNVGSSDAQFTVVNPPTYPVNLGPNDFFNITIRFNPSAAGNQSSTITVTTNPVLSVGNTITATGVGLVPVIRLDLPSFGSVPADDATNPGNNTRDSVLKIHNNGQANLSISNITITGAMGADTWTILDPPAYPLLIPPGSFQNVTIRFNPDDTASGMRTATVNVFNNTTVSPALITASGFAFNGIVNLELQSNGGVPWDDAANPGNNFSDRTLRIFNTGTANIKVTGIAFSGADAADFSLPSFTPPVTIAAGSQFDVTVRFNPSSAGAKNATVTVTYDPSAQTTSIGASGYGLEPGIYVELPDFGAVPWDDEANDLKFVDKVLNIHNTGSANLIIKSVSATGDFSVVDAPTDGTSISPDATLPVTIRFNPSASGQRTGTVTVTYYTNYGTSATSTKSITATGVGLTPNIYLKVNDFGAIGVDDATNPVYISDQDLIIHNTGSSNLIIKSVTGCGDFAVVNAPADGTVVSPDANLPVTIRFNPTSGGAKNCMLTVTYYTDYAGGGSGTTASVTIPATGIGLEPKLSLELAGFGGVPVDDAANPGNFAVDRVLKIHNTGQANLQVTAITSSDSQFVVSPETSLVFPINIAPNDVFNVTVRFNPTSGGNQSSTITVTTAPALTGNTVVATGVGLEPIIRLDLPSFGSVPSDDGANPGNNTRDSVLKIHNNGQAVLSVSAISFTGVMDADSWTIVDPVTFPLLIPPGSFQNVTIRFNPDDDKSGARTATVNVTNNTLANSVNPQNSPATVLATAYAYREDIKLELPSHGPVAWDDNANPGKNYVDKELNICNVGVGNANLVVTAIVTSGGNASDFSILVNSGDLPMTIQGGECVPVTVRFNPSAAGQRSTTIVVTYDPDAQTTSITATGYGLDPAIYLQLTDFGTVPWDDEANAFKYVDRTLLIHNTGSANLILKSVAATGDYSVIGGPADGTSVSPDATFPVTIRFNPSAAGQISGTVTVTYYTDYTGSAVTTRQIAATGIGLGIAPPYLEIPFFGGVPVDDATNPVYYKDNELQIHNYGDANLILKSVTATGDFAVIGGPADGTKLSPNSTFPVTIRFNPTAGGLRQGTITVTYYTDYAGGTAGTTATVTITAEGIGLVPNVYTVLSDFGAVPIEDAPINGYYFSYFVDRELKIQNTGDANISVTGITVTGTNAADFTIVNPPTFPISIGPGKALGNITVRFNPTGSPTSGGNRTATINVHYNPGAQTYSIAATGVALSPVIDATGPINFGALPVVDGLGAECGPYEKEEVIFIFSKGQAILNVTSVTCVGTHCTDFTVLSPVTFPENVQPGQTITVRIRFNPSAAGARSATIRIASNAGTVDVPVSGIGLVGDPVLTPVPQLTFEPTVVGFEPQCYGDKIVTLYNRGPACIRVDSIGIIEDATGSYKILEAPTTPFILGAGKGIPIKVQFNPTLVQRQITAKVEVISDDGEVTEKTVTTNLCGEGVNTGLRVLVYDKFNNLLDGTNGFVSKVQISSKGLKPAVKQKFLANELLLKEIDGCAEGDDDIKFHLEYQLPPSYSQGGLINKSVFKVTVWYYTSTWSKVQKHVFTVELPECGGFKIIKIQALK